MSLRIAAHETQSSSVEDGQDLEPKPAFKSGIWRRPIRVLHVLEATAGGTRRYLNEVLLALPRSEVEPIVGCAVGRDLSFCDDLVDYQKRGIAVHLIPMVRPPRMFRDAIACVRLRKLIRDVGCDVVHLHSGKAGLIGRLAAAGMKCPIIYSPHAFPFLQPGWIGKAGWVAERWLARRTNLLLAVSHAEGRLAVEERLSPLHAVRVVQNAIDVPRHLQRVGPLASFRPANEFRRFGLIGELRLQKQPLLFLEAARRVLQRGIRARFILPNRGDLFPHAIDFVAKHGLAPHITFSPTVDSLDSMYREMDIGVLPSRYEGMPYTVLDTLALGRPVVGSNIPVLRDLLGALDRRLLCEAGDANALASTLELWAGLPSEELERVGREGRRIVEQHHSVATWVAELVDVYRNATSSAVCER